MAVRIVEVAPSRAPLYAERLARAVAEIYDELPADAERACRLEDVLRRDAAEPGFLLLAAEPAGAVAAAGAPAAEAGVLLVLPQAGFLGSPPTPCLRVLQTVPAARHRGIASALLERAIEVLRGRGFSILLADAMYGDDAIVGLFERRGFVRGRMSLLRALDGS